MIQLKHIAIPIITAIFTCLQACEYISYVNEESEIITKVKSTEPVNAITIDASCRVILTITDEMDITITGQTHLLDNLETSYNNGTLKIDHKTHTLQKKKLIEIMVPANALSRITCSKPCEIISQDLITVNNLSMVMNGSSEFTESDIDITCNKLSVFCYGNTNIGQHVFKGNINELYMKLEGRIKVNAMELTANKATIINKSAYDSYVNVKQQLTVNTYSTGNTFYIGNPEINHQRVHVPYLNSTGEVISYQ